MQMHDIQFAYFAGYWAFTIIAIIAILVKTSRDNSELKKMIADLHAETMNTGSKATLARAAVQASIRPLTDAERKLYDDAQKEYDKMVLSDDKDVRHYM